MASPVPTVYRTVQEMRQIRDEARVCNHKIAFVPTMGALHEGHLSLVKLARMKAEVVVVSVFVNPTQFAPHEDYDQYPRTLDQDLKLLQPYQNYVFAPCVQTMYSNLPESTHVNVGNVSGILEGEIRPHFFKGVCTVVTKLLNIVEPDMVFFGQKDVQQCLVIRTMLRELHLRVTMYVGPTVREEDGLAMSSRNRYLSPQERKIALKLSKALLSTRELFEKKEVRECSQLIAHAFSFLDNQEGLITEYVHVGSPFDLSKLEVVGEDGGILCAAIRVGGTRLIDNVLLGCTL